MTSHNSYVIFFIISGSFAAVNQKTMLRSLTNDKVAVKCLTIAMDHTNSIVDQTKSRMTLYSLAAHCTYVNAITTNPTMVLYYLKEHNDPAFYHGISEIMCYTREAHDSEWKRSFHFM